MENLLNMALDATTLEPLSEKKGTTYIKRKCCLNCRADRFHEIRRYLEPTDNLRSFHYRCLLCNHTGEE